MTTPPPTSADHPDRPEPRGELLGRIEDLERRLARLEASQPATTPDAPAPRPVPGAPVPPPTVPATEPVRPPTPPPIAPAPPASPFPPRVTPPSAPAGGPAREAVPTVAVAPRAPTAHPPRPAQAPGIGVSVEQLIGGKWFLVLGALIVVAGVGFFLKLAYDQGWIGNIPPVARCGMAGVFGLALIGVGLFTERRLGRFAGVGFTAAGLGVLYATAYAAYAIFELVGPGPAFGMLCVVAGLGLALGVRGRSLLLAVLSLAGGYLTPLILDRPDSPAWALPPYLLALMLVGSALAVYDRRYRPLASIVWWATGAMGALWITYRGHELPWLGLGLVAVVWAVVHATRLRLRDDPTAESRWLAAAASFSTSLWAFGGAWYLADRLGLDQMWLVPAAGAAVTLLAGLALAGMLRAFTDKPATNAEALGVSLLCQAGAFMPIAVMLGIDTAWSQVLVWLALGLAASAAGRWIRAGSLAWYGAALLVIGTLRVLVEVLGPLADGTPSAVGLVFTWWMALMFLTAGAWLGVAALAAGVRKPVPHHLRVLCVMACVAAGVLLAVGVLHEDATPEGILLAYLTLSVAGFVGGALASRRGEAVWVRAAGPVYLSLASMVWTARFLNEDWYLNRTDAAPLAHPGLLWCLPLAALWAIAGAGASRMSDKSWRETRLVAWPIAMLLALTATTMEVARVAGTLTADHTVRAGSVSVWWAVVATALLVVGFARKAPWLRYTGIGLLLVTTGKALTWDLSQVSPAVRVACFMALGLVLLGVAAWYLRSARVTPPDQPAEPPNDPPTGPEPTEREPT